MASLFKNVYLASPFFNEYERATVKNLERLIEELGYLLYSPSRDGLVLKKDSPQKDLDEAFDGNLKAMDDADIFVVNIDEHTDLRDAFRDYVKEDKEFSTSSKKVELSSLVESAKSGKDTGTIWETGYAYARNKTIVTFTTQDMPINLMLANCVVAHATTYSQLHDVLKELIEIPRESSIEAKSDLIYKIREKNASTLGGVY